jgi:hypothetical protein
MHATTKRILGGLVLGRALMGPVRAAAPLADFERDDERIERSGRSEFNPWGEGFGGRGLKQSPP